MRIERLTQGIAYVKFLPSRSLFRSLLVTLSFGGLAANAATIIETDWSKHYAGSPRAPFLKTDLYSFIKMPLACVNPAKILADTVTQYGQASFDSDRKAVVTLNKSIQEQAVGGKR